MEPLSKEDRKRVFHQELLKLREGEYISLEQFAELSRAHHHYFAELKQAELEKHDLERISREGQKDEKISQATATHLPSQKPATTIKPKPVKKKKKLTAEEIRERNITWSLNIGVILLLIGGLFVATSNWATMTNWMKAVSIAGVSGLFYGIAYISKRILRIDKTAFAFIVLASLFLPIFILSVGWFELLGPYFSFYGEGRFILGLAGSGVLLPIYVISAKRLSSRLFVWVSYITATFVATYGLLSFGLAEDGFYLGIMAFNAVLIILYHRFKARDQYKLFSLELPSYVQINLVLSTLLMLLFFENHVFFGFNLILTSVIYLSMIFVSGRREYHFVFTAMLIYGVYQLIEFSILEDIGPIAFALLGLIFLAVPKVTGDQFKLETIFRWTSAVVSVLAFLYISLEGMLLRMEDASIVLLLAYLIIAGNFIYLSNIQSNFLFKHLSPIFISSALFEGVRLVDKWAQFDNLTLPVFFIGFILYLLLGVLNKVSFLQVVVTSSKDIGIFIMLASILGGVALFNWIEVAVMMLLFAFISYLAYTTDTRKLVRIIARSIIPVSLGFSVASLCEELRVSSSFYEMELGVATNLGAAGLLLLLISYTWKKLGLTELIRSTVFTSQAFYSFGIILALSLPMNEVWVRPLFLLIGIALYLILYKYTSWKWVSYLVGVTTLITYFMVLFSAHIKVDFPQTLESIQLTVGAVVLMLIALLVRGKEGNLASGFAWVGHLYLPIALLLTYFVYGERSLWSFIAAITIYGVSIYLAKLEWMISTLLYAAFASLFFISLTGLRMAYDIYDPHYVFLVTSFLIAVFWLLADEIFKKRTTLFLIPFSLLGIATFVQAYPYDWILYAVTIAYAVGVLFFLHVAKADIANLIPLLLLFYGTNEFLYGDEVQSVTKVLISGGLGVVAVIAGTLLYEKILEEPGKGLSVKLDSYTCVSILFFGLMYTFPVELLVVKVLPGILISLTLWLQRDRVPESYKTAVTFLAGAYLLQPYYQVVNELQIPPLFEREVYVLPWVALVIFLQVCMKGQYRKIIDYIQWIVLVLVALFLIQDGLASNTVYDALILGTLSLVSMLVGMFVRVKSYFFVGAGVLLLNVILQTRPFWGNLPWWAYLLISGAILITVASYNEWHKQKASKGEPTLITVLKEKVLNALKKWN